MENKDEDLYLHNLSINIRDGSKLGIATGYYEKFMEALGIPQNQHSKGTAERVAKMWVNELTEGYEPLDFKCTVFEEPDQRNRIIVVRDVEFYSVCSHHHIPFFGTVDFAYMVRENLVGLSKIPRLIKHVSRKPNTQELLGDEIAKTFYDLVSPVVVALRIKAKHLCMSMRGIENQGAFTETWHGCCQPSHIDFYEDLRRDIRG